MIAVVVALGADGCRESAKTSDPPESPDVLDSARLGRIVAADETLDRALQAADDASRGGDDAKGARLLENEATRAANDAIAEAEREPVETSWAKARRDALLSVMRERKASIAPYAEAMRGDDLGAKLAIVTLQVDLQKRALETAAAALAPAGSPGSPPAVTSPTGDAG